MEILARAKDDSSILFLDEKGIERDMPIFDFNKQYGVYGVIRLNDEEFEFAKRNNKFTHFNLQFTGHKEGKSYALMRILRHGYFNGKIEELPLLDIRGMITARCTYVRDYISYDRLIKTDFKNTIVSSAEELKELILKKYSKSLPYLSCHKILSSGVGITKLEVHKRT